MLGAFVLGGDEDDISVFQSTLEFIEASGIDVLQVTKPTPLPGTQLWHQLNDADRLLNQDFPKAWEDYRLTKMVFKPQKLSIEEVYEGFTYIREKYYGLWNTLKRAVSTLLTTKNIVTAVVAYKFNASYRRAYIDSEHRKIYNRPGLAAKYGRAKPQ